MDKHTILRRLLWGLLTVTATLLFTACPDTDDIIDSYDPRNITRMDDHIESLADIAVDSDGLPHVVYQGHNYEDPINVYYTHLTEDSQWTTPERLSDGAHEPHGVIDSQDRLHVIWSENNAVQTYYSMQRPNEPWTGSIPISPEQTDQPRIAVDRDDHLHVIGNSLRGRYRQKIGSDWLEEEELKHNILNPVLAVSNDGTVHIIYESGTQQIAYLERLPDGAWQDWVVLSEEPGHPWAASIATGPDGTVYAAWTVAFTDQIKLCKRPPGEEWTTPDSIPDMVGDPGRSRMAADTRGVHIVWNAHTEDWDYDIYYQMWQKNGTWSSRTQVSQTTSASLDPSIDLYNGHLHIVWHEKYDRSMASNRDVYYDIIEVNINR